MQSGVQVRRHSATAHQRPRPEADEPPAHGTHQDPPPEAAPADPQPRSPHYLHHRLPRRDGAGRCSVLVCVRSAALVQTKRIPRVDLVVFWKQTSLPGDSTVTVVSSRPPATHTHTHTHARTHTQDHRALVDFVKEMQFERAGVFAYSSEEGTPAATMAEQVSPTPATPSPEPYNILERGRSPCGYVKKERKQVPVC